MESLSDLARPDLCENLLYRVDHFQVGSKSIVKCSHYQDRDTAM